ncbi:MAG: hypothetical protein CSA74_04095 [Rhodobacterales bacterium]|nr:MAG: hypothetical protein CSA74_04095 [Rhodobacterales bacterium]
MRPARAFLPPLAALFALVAPPMEAGPLEGVKAEVFILGEVHDNPAHHRVQAEAVADIAPRALVFEMLTPGQVGRAAGVARGEAEAFDWAGGGWPDFAMYHPILAAAPKAVIYGAAVPRDASRAAMEAGVVQSFGNAAGLYGLTGEIDTEQLAERLNLQLAAHCGAMPPELMPGMVEVQRLRDATLARVALLALAETGGPVVVIAGNGHARRDWGVPSYLARVAPGVAVFVLGQGEDGDVPDGGFDMVLDAPAAERDDPCAVFEQAR